MIVSVPAATATALTCKCPLAYCAAVADAFQALAAPARRAILDALKERERQTLFELTGRLIMNHGLELSRQAVSQHLDVLEEAGLVLAVREGRHKYLSFEPAPLEGLLDRWLK